MRDTRRMKNWSCVLAMVLGACAPSMSPSDSGVSASDSATDSGVGPLDATSSVTDSGSMTSGDASSGVRPLGDFRDGIATYYDATGAGNCSFPASPGDLLVAAMNTPEWNNSAVCGSCAEVMGPNGSVTVRIVDRCPECAAGHLDLSQQAFARIAPIASGRVNTRWRFVSCDVRGPIALQWKDGTNPYWAAIQVRNHRLAVSGVAIRPMSGGMFRTLDRQDYNYFVGTNLGAGPFEVRVTAQDGQEITESNVPLGDNTAVMGTQQFR